MVIVHIFDFQCNYYWMTTILVIGKDLWQYIENPVIAYVLKSKIGKKDILLLQIKIYSKVRKRRLRECLLCRRCHHEKDELLINIIHINNVENKLLPSLLSVGFFLLSNHSPCFPWKFVLKKRKKENYYS